MPGLLRPTPAQGKGQHSIVRLRVRAHQISARSIVPPLHLVISSLASAGGKFADATMEAVLSRRSGSNIHLGSRPLLLGTRCA